MRLLPVLLFALAMQAAPPQRAVVTLAAVGGSGATGTARLDAFEEGTRVELRIRGLDDGLHGVAFVEGAACDEAAGPHLDRHGRLHGDPEDPRPLHHDGDLGNVRVTDGAGRLDRVYTDVALDAVLGRLLVVYAEADDLNSQPTGGAGAPVACGVVTAAD